MLQQDYECYSRITDDKRAGKGLQRIPIGLQSITKVTGKFTEDYKAYREVYRGLHGRITEDSEGYRGGLPRITVT